MECLANPARSEYWGAHRAIVNWITEFTTTIKENLVGLAEEERRPDNGSGEPGRPGTPYMELTDDFDLDEGPAFPTPE